MEPANGRLRVFMSLPFSNRSDDDVKRSLSAMRKWWFATQTVNNRFYRDDEVQFIDNFDFEPDIPEVPAKVITGFSRAYCLGEAIKKMAACDIVLFSNEWLQATGCRFEMDICRAYKIPYIIMKIDGGAIVG
jgi:hypothetical protein